MFTSAESKAQNLTSNRRREERVRFRRAVEILPCGDDDRGGGYVRAELEDCSVHGIGLKTDLNLPPGSQFMLKVPLATPQIVLYTVRNRGRLADPPPHYRVGAEYDGLVSGTVGRESIVQALRSLSDSH
jgi:hypothetical protein